MIAVDKKCPTCGATYASAVVFCPEDGAVLRVEGDPLIGEVIAERYRVISRIGEGGMGRVYMAEHVRMHRRCAVKLLSPDLAGDAGAMKRFIREAENASRIEHPNVVTMYDFGEAEGGLAYLAMEYVEGESLRKRIEREGALPLDVVTSVVRQTASALEAAHRLQIVHRDLKPDNIMLLTRDGDLRIKIVDFGIAKAKDPAQKVTLTGAIVGTPDYMSPEQVTGDEVDGRADQYALALVAVKMLTGQLPFAPTTGIESLTSRLTTKPMALRELRHDVAWPQQLQEVIAKALAPMPNDRFATIADFARQFDRSMSRVDGAVAATVPDLNIADLHIPEAVPPTRVGASATPGDIPATRVGPAAPRQTRFSSAWLATAAIVLVAGGAAVVWTVRRPDATPSTQLNQRLAAADTSPAAETSAAAHAPQDTTAQPQGTAVVPNPERAVFDAPKKTASSGADAKPRAPAPLPERPAPAVTGSGTAPPGRTAVAPGTVDSARSSVVPTPAVVNSASPSPTPSPATTATTLSSDAIRTEVARARALAGTGNVPAMDSAAAQLDAVLTRSGDRADSIRVLYARAQVSAMRGDTPHACRTLARALQLAAGTSVQGAIARTASDLNCP